MSKKMLIDAAHPEETRVVVVENSRIEELDFESRNKRQLRGNVYLARVTRVEPSLQAAFVEYGGNRHGFLAFSEIHPDYYQIPYEDRMALLEAEEADSQIDDDDDEDVKKSDAVDETDETDSDATDSSDDSDDDSDTDVGEGLETAADDASDSADAEVAEEQAKTASNRRKRMSRRRYKIQEVIKRGQILLIQVVKEERGNKGAALTTYLSLAGRYCVLMPNTPRGGGISRKISTASDRKRLKTIVADLDVPQGIGVIVRTAGAKRTKMEIKRDYDYLIRLWEEIRETTLKSIAPSLIHEEGNLVKRSIRDLYSKEIDEVLVQGDDAYKTAKTFIKMLMPSHAKNVKQYKDDIPLFLRHHVEGQIEDSLDSTVQLKSGGYLVIHPTEALVSVDVNSGRATRERNVEKTALKTNLEAADEVARQMRLRDLAGLVVIDFIDMDENRNNRAVEKRMKDALAKDRARVQAGRISQFGLMEISRQRRRRSLLEGSTMHCDHCGGVGRRRTIESSALRALRAVEEAGVRGKAAHIRLKIAPDVATYIINEKRALLTQIDDQFDMFTEILSDPDLLRPSHEIEIVETAKADKRDLLKDSDKEDAEKRKSEAKNKPARGRGRKKSDEADTDENETAAEKNPRSNDQEDEDGTGKRRRRRGRRGGRGRNNDSEHSKSDSSANNQNDDGNAPNEDNDENDTDEKPKSSSRRSRGRRSGGRSKDSRASHSKSLSDITDGETPSDTHATAKTEADSEKPPITRSTARRKAPGRKDRSDTSSDASNDAPVKASSRASSRSASDDDASKTQTKRTSARRKAPTRKPSKDQDITETSATASTPVKAPAKAPAKAKPARTTGQSAARRPAPKKTNAETPADSSVEDTAAKKAPARRKAPTKKAAPKKAVKKPAEKTATAKKVTARKAAPRKAASRKPAPEKSVATDQTDTDALSTPKSPAKKTSAKTSAVKKAPVKKAAKETPVAETVAASVETAPAIPHNAPSTAKDDPVSEGKKPRRKRTGVSGWWQRRTKD